MGLSGNRGLGVGLLMTFFPCSPLHSDLTTCLAFLGFTFRQQNALKIK